MLNKNDKKYISETIKGNNEILVKEVMELFNVTNSRIDKVLEKLDEHNDYLNDHERRIEKLEDKILAT